MTNNPLGSKPILTFILSIIALLGYTQTDKVIIEGKSYYVYPHQQAVVGIQEYYMNFADFKEVIKRDDRNEKIVSISEEPVTELEKKAAIKFPKSYKKYLKDFEEILERYPYFMVTSDNGIAIDPTPALVSIPDGEYVLFYRDIPYISKRVLRYKNDIVAAFFSVKNNMIEGKSTWFSPEGKIVKTGNYLNSEKTGRWQVFDYTQKFDESYTYNPKESIENRLEKAIYDTTKTSITFLNGLKNGPFTIYENQELLTSGNFLNDQASGSWEIYEFKTTVSVDKKGKLTVTKGKEKILIDRYTLRSDKKRGKSPIMRHSVIPYDFMNYDRADTLVLKNNSSPNRGDYELGYELDFPDFNTFLSVLETETNTMELPEENLTSYEGEEEMYEDEYYNGEMEFTPGTNYNPNEYYEFVNGKRYTLNDLIDSAGYLYAYEGIVEHYYQNGQLQYRFEIKDGTLLKEAPVYWDNGTIANEVVFISDSNKYVQRFYDYNGVLYHETWHDSKGNILSDSKKNNYAFVTINQKEYDRNYEIRQSFIRKTRN
jgi:antitoxin component YwqK of YwqJK toxin-antitoxin module